MLIWIEFLTKIYQKFDRQKDCPMKFLTDSVEKMIENSMVEKTAKPVGKFVENG